MRSPVVLLLCALAGVLGGGALIGLPALGGCLIFDALAVGAWGVLHYDPAPAARGEEPAGPVPLAEYLGRKAAEPW